jgi:hypothetical protein
MVKTFAALFFLPIKKDFGTTEPTENAEKCQGR